MIRLTYRCFHIPELCKCEYHQNKFYTNIEEREFLSVDEAMRQLVLWNCDCWVYAPIKIEKIYE